MSDIDDLFSTLMQSVHLIAASTAIVSLTEASMLSPIVPETSRTTVTAYDEDGRILSTKTTKTPRHTRNFDVIIKKRMHKLRQDMGGANNPSAIYFDAFEHVWRTDAVKRAQMLAKAPPLDEWAKQADAWNAKRRTPRAETTVQYMNRRATNFFAKRHAAAKAKRAEQLKSQEATLGSS